MTCPEMNAALNRPSCTVGEFANLFGLSRNAAYEAIERGDIHSIRIGKRIVVPTAPLRKMLLVEEAGLTSPKSAAA